MTCTTQPAPPWTPRGWGVFYDSGAMFGDVLERVELLRECGARWALLWLLSPDGRRVEPDRLARHVEALVAADIDVTAWLFPHPHAIAEAVDVAGAALGAYHDAIRLLVADMEVSPSDRTGRRKAGVGWSRVDSERIGTGLAELTSEHGATLGLSTYPILSWHPKVELEPIAQRAQLTMPQLYRNAESSSRIERCFSQHSALGAHLEISPTIDSFVGDDERMRGVIPRVLQPPGHRSAPRCKSASVWTLRTTDRTEARVLREYADRTGF
jgi:hypothetical protein